MIERLALLTSFPRAMHLAAFELDADKKLLNLKKSVFIAKDDDFKELRTRLGRLFYPRRYKIIWAPDPGEALTLYKVIRYAREDPKKPLDDAELENLISKAMWQVYEEGRFKAVADLKVSNIDLLLMDANVSDIFIDQKSWAENSGVKGREADIDLSLTFVNRALVSRLKAALPHRAEVKFAVEGGTALTHVLRTGKSPLPFLVASVLSDRVNLFLGTKDRISFFDSFLWGSDNLPRTLSLEYKIHSGVAEAIVDKLNENDLAPSASKQLMKHLNKEIRTLLHGLGNAKKESRARMIFIDARELCNIAKFPKIIECVMGRHLFDFFGFKEAESRRRFPVLKKEENRGFPDLPLISSGVILEYSLSPRNETLNRFAHRRMKWLLA